MHDPARQLGVDGVCRLLVALAAINAVAREVEHDGRLNGGDRLTHRGFTRQVGFSHGGTRARSQAPMDGLGATRHESHGGAGFNERTRHPAAYEA